MEINTKDPVIIKYQQLNKDLMYNQHEFSLKNEKEKTN